MESEELDELINELKSLIPDPPPIFESFLERHDWAPVWRKVGDIMAGFRSGVRYPTGAQRHNAWNRFRELRETATQRSSSETEQLRWRSERLRDEILHEARSAEYVPLNYAMTLSIETRDDMIRLGEQLRKAGRMLSENKLRMLGEHKRECFDRIKEVQEGHDAWWAEHRTHMSVRREDSRERIRANIEKNQELLTRASEALERHRSRVEDLREKIASATSEEWEERFGEWLAEAEEKIDSIEEGIAKLEGWIENDKRALDQLGER